MLNATECTLNFYRFLLCRLRSGNPIKEFQLSAQCKQTPGGTIWWVTANLRIHYSKCGRRFSNSTLRWVWNTPHKKQWLMHVNKTYPSSFTTEIWGINGLKTVVVWWWQHGEHKKTNTGKYQLLMHTAHQPALPISSWVHPSMTSEGRVDRNHAEIASLFKICTEKSEKIIMRKRSVVKL